MIAASLHRRDMMRTLLAAGARLDTDVDGIDVTLSAALPALSEGAAPGEFDASLATLALLQASASSASRGEVRGSLLREARRLDAETDALLAAQRSRGAAPADAAAQEWVQHRRNQAATLRALASALRASRSAAHG